MHVDRHAKTTLKMRALIVTRALVRAGIKAGFFVKEDAAELRAERARLWPAPPSATRADRP